jgi:hypothetical protein
MHKNKSYAKLRFHSVVSTPSTSVADPDPYVFGPPGSGTGSISQSDGSGSVSFYHQAKIVRKTLIPTFLRLLYDFPNQNITDQQHCFLLRLGTLNLV